MAKKQQTLTKNAKILSKKTKNCHNLTYIAINGKYCSYIVKNSQNCHVFSGCCKPKCIAELYLLYFVVYKRSSSIIQRNGPNVTYNIDYRIPQGFLLGFPFLVYLSKPVFRFSKEYKIGYSIFRVQKFAVTSSLFQQFTAIQNLFPAI